MDVIRGPHFLSGKLPNSIATAKRARINPKTICVSVVVKLYSLIRGLTNTLHAYTEPAQSMIIKEAIIITAVLAFDSTYLSSE